MTDDETKIEGEESNDQAVTDAELAKKAALALELDRAIEGKSKEVEKLQSKIKTLSKEKNEVKATQVTPEVGGDEEELKTVEGWQKLIDKKAAEHAQPALNDIEKLRTAQRAKAVKQFQAAHPEYAASEEKTEELIATYARVKSRDDLDADSVLEDLEDAWVVQNRPHLVSQLAQAARAKEEVEAMESDAAASGAGSYEPSGAGDVTATPQQRRIAASIGMPLKKYLELEKQREGTMMGR